MKTGRRKILARGMVTSLFLCLMFPAMVSPGDVLADDQGKNLLTIYVVNYPLKYFAERIAGTYANVVFPAPKGEDPAFWNPPVDTIAAYQKADLILLNGAGYARWVEKASLPRSKLVNTSARFKDQYIRVEGAVTHSHGAGGEHAHEGVAFTTWIDFDLAIKQAETVYNALSRMRSSLDSEFQANYVMLAKDLKEIGEAIQKTVSQNPSKPLIGSHPVYDYFSRKYGLSMKSVHWEPDEIPDTAQWAELQKLRKGFPAKWMVWEGAPMQATVHKLESSGIKSLVFDPCGNVPEKGDFLGVMKQNVENLKSAFVAE
jgi:zinc transport system substrate-binding protein